MKYAPGSFTKNFAWHGTGLARLHTAVSNGYQSQLKPISREIWRTNSGISDRSLDLIPINFFLHNKDGRLSVDELVFQAIRRPHSLSFDRLGLFALHLNRVGKPPLQGPPRPAMWANEFARNVLWKRGSWQTKPLTDRALDGFIKAHMVGNSVVRTKCRNNYRHLFQLCGFWPTHLSTINSGADDWMPSALFLAWDRLILDSGPQSKADLLSWVSAEELHKLMGVTKGDVDSVAKSLVSKYLAAGALDRFHRASSTRTTTGSKTKPSTLSASGTSMSSLSSPSAISEADVLDEEGSNEAVARKSTQTSVQVRNQRIAARLRLGYRNTCQFCRDKLQIGDDRFYAEAAHIKPLGTPHNGPDKTSNLLVLCPNHHLQFDHGILRIRKKGTKFVIYSKIKNDRLHGRPLKLEHKIDVECVRWHFNWFAQGKR